MDFSDGGRWVREQVARDNALNLAFDRCFAQLQLMAGAGWGREEVLPFIRAMIVSYDMRELYRLNKLNADMVDALHNGG